MPRSPRSRTFIFTVLTSVAKPELTPDVRSIYYGNPFMKDGLEYVQGFIVFHFQRSIRTTAAMFPGAALLRFGGTPGQATKLVDDNDAFLNALADSDSDSVDDSVLDLESILYLFPTLPL